MAARRRFHDRFHACFHTAISDAALSMSRPDAASVAPGPCSSNIKGERTMPLIEVHLIENIFDSAQKKQMIEKLTDAMVSIEGENMRSVTWVKISEVASGEWGIGGQPLTSEAVKALAAGKKAA
jgi:4-oxalocrotonate tautomerase